MHIRRRLSSTGALIGAAVFLSLTAVPSHAQRLFGLRGHGSVHRGVAQSRALSRLDASSGLELAISLPVRNQALLDATIQELYDPNSPNYHQYFSVDDFNKTFGPTDQDYNTVITFLKAHGLAVSQTYKNRMIVDVRGSIGSIEQTFHVHMNRYQHPTENRTFFGPDAEPTVDQSVPILDVTGLDNFTLPKPKSTRVSSVAVSSATGTAPGGGYRGNDYRAAYCPRVTLDGKGQTIALFQFGSYYPADITSYCTQSGLPPASVSQVLLNGVSSTPAAGSDTLEQSLDIEMTHAMAPAANILFYTGNNAADIWNRIATDNIAKQVSSSWSVSPPPSTLNQILQQMATQGQSVFNASGDGGYSASPFGWDDNPYMTSVGGTVLTTAGAGGPQFSETGWASSSGYISPNFPIPTWQQGISMAANGGSTTERNCPDVAMVADSLWTIWNNGATGYAAGTSAASPLWAGYMALVNQQAAAHGKPTAGFINPAVYALGKSGSYGANFYDVTSGSNGKPAVAGYDLVTGWGSPKGQALINYLSGSTGDAPFFMIVNQTSGKCLDLIGGSLSNSANTNQWSYDYNGPNQRWALVPTEGGNHFKIVSWVSGKSVSVSNDSTANSAQLWAYDYTGNNPSQQWDLVDAGNGWYNIKNVRSGLLMDVSGSSTADNAKIQQYANTNSGAQRWRFQPWGNYYIRADGGRYICVQGAGSTNGSSIIQYDQQSNPWFKWSFTSESDGFYGLFSLNAPSRVLCVANGSSAAGWNTHLWDYNVSNAGDQKIRILPKTNGKFKFYWQHDGMTWDIPGGATGNNINLQQYPDNGNSWQDFGLERIP
ncbi:MAG: RICIN domain-containing protein [Capsulimonas sp.]|uniref:RICIN domain-containing protein n=1 Tax=Capsulimonas sp. TaxID=2494211 RepID=UPI00326328EE